MTAQVMEVLVHKGEEHFMAAEPLRSYLYDQRPNLQFDAPHTACWRGYKGAWEIVNGNINYNFRIHSYGSILKIVLYFCQFESLFDWPGFLYCCDNIQTIGAWNEQGYGTILQSRYSHPLKGNLDRQCLDSKGHGLIGRVVIAPHQAVVEGTRKLKMSIMALAFRELNINTDSLDAKLYQRFGYYWLWKKDKIKLVNALCESLSTLNERLCLIESSC